MELKKLNSQKINNPMKKWANELNRAFSKEEVQIGQKTCEEMLNIPGCKGSENQNHVKIHLEGNTRAQEINVSQLPV
jgi:hypothetical protein